jgi:hypothetical protein
MSKHIFSLSNYRTGLVQGLYNPPEALCPYYQVDQVLYRNLESTTHRRGKLQLALEELHKRMGPTYFLATYPFQMSTLTYSTRTFPAYRFILPEVMTEDWLAIVDWGRFQRDHVLHQPLCGYVLLKLLDGDEINGPIKITDGQTILDKCVENILSWKETAYLKDFLINCGLDEKNELFDNNSPIARNVWRSIFRETAYVASIFHDLGYPWQYAESMQGNLEGINTPFVGKNRSSEQIVKLFGHRLLFYAINGYQKPDISCPSTWNERIIRLTDDALSKTHGLPGALGFLHLNDCIRRYPNSNRSPFHLLCLEWAAIAIMMHDMKNMYWGKDSSGSMTPQNPFLRLSFERDPLSSIVTLVDVIQEFERPSVTYGFHNSSVTLAYDKACSHTEILTDGLGTLTLRYKMVNTEMLANKLRYLPNEKREYFDNQYGYLDMKSIGINSVRLEAFC